jgi:Asp-tRNA(Asn)/Glu-tRNA(Gln) amidotransferase A subunit family amidase
VKEALARYSEWLGYGHAERAEAWIARLELNRPELEAFRTAPASAEAPYVATATTVAPADGSEALDGGLARDAEEARKRAAKDPHKAFTFVPRAPSPEGEARIPVAVKDLMAVKGMPLTGGSKAMGAEVSGRDAAVVARLKDHGYSVIGLTNLHEFAYGITSANPHFGAVVNPAAPDRIPGGSSGGSASAVASGVVRLAIGTDTAGSIRVPAACCGIVGFKPSYDALPRDGVLDLGSSLDHVGPMTDTVEAAAGMFAAMLGFDAPPKWGYRDLARIRVGRLRGYFEEPIDPEVRDALDRAQTALEADGARLSDVTIDGMALAAAVQLNILCAEAGAVHAQRVKESGALFGEDVRVRVEMANFLPGHWYVKAQRMRTGLVRNIEAAFAGADVLLCATLRSPAPRVGASHVRMGARDFPAHTAVTQLTMPFNLSGLPAVAVPWGKSREGVPISLQVVAPRGRDWRALAVAQRLQSIGG